MKKTIYILAFVWAIAAEAQINESFTGVVPIGWGEWSENFISWEHNTDFGNEALGCIMIRNTGSTASKTRLETPYVDLSSVLNPEMNFSAALIKNNFLAPSIGLLYNIGDGWVLLEQWNGDGDDNPIDNTFNPEETLSVDNVTWVTLNYDLSDFANETNISFAMQADIINGGWVLIDDVNMTNDGPSNLSVGEQNQVQFSLYPNPTNGTIYINTDPSYCNKALLHDLSGKRIKLLEIETAETVLAIEDLAKGTYLLSLYHDEKLMTTKRVVLK